MNKLLIVILLSILFCNKTPAQKLFNENCFISPGISIGHTFGAKFNFGFVLDFGLIACTENNLRYGLSFSYYNIKVKEDHHKQRSLNLMLQNDFFDVKIGHGRIRNGWGFENRNKCIVHGFSGDISFNYPSKYSPVIGYKAFIYNRDCWAWFEKQYQSIYIGYEYLFFQKE